MSPLYISVFAAFFTASAMANDALDEESNACMPAFDYEDELEASEDVIITCFNSPVSAILFAASSAAPPAAPSAAPSTAPSACPPAPQHAASSLTAAPSTALPVYKQPKEMIIKWTQWMHYWTDG